MVPGGGGRRAPRCAPSHRAPAEPEDSPVQESEPALRLAPSTPPATSGSLPTIESVGPRHRVPWAELLRKVFALDVLECPRCAGRLEVIAYIAEPTVARRILDHLGLASQAPPVARARSADEGLRRKFGLPGMAILQFAFGNDPQAPGFLPHNYGRDLVAYSGRMNRPSTASGNWRWRLREGELTPALVGRLGQLTATYGR